MTWSAHMNRHRRALTAGGIATCSISLLLIAVHPRDAMAGWLAAFVFCSSFPVGSLFLLFMIRLIPGRWGPLLSAPTTAATILLPCVLIAALPILMAPGQINDWADAQTQNGFQAVYLTPWFYALRTILFVSVGSIVAYASTYWESMATRWAVIGLIILVPFHALIATDWLMSHDPEFHSSGFGLYILSIQMPVALCAVILACIDAGLSGIKPREDDIGLLSGLLLTALLLWAYFAFLQYLIIWSGNAPAGARWYQHLQEHGWGIVGLVVAILHAGPMLVLMLPPLRRSSLCLASSALIILLAKLAEIARLVLAILDVNLTIALPALLLGTGGLSVLLAAGLSWDPREMVLRMSSSGEHRR